MTAEREWHFALEELPTVAKQLLEALGSRRIVALRGDMGAGKTTLVQAICQTLGVAAQVNSPTFAIEQVYEGSRGPVHHLDLYRLQQPSELAVLDLESTLDRAESGEAWVFIEWPEVAGGLQPTSAALAWMEVSPAGEEWRRLRLFSHYF